MLEKMSKKQVKAVRATPFGHFLDSPNVRISTKCIKAILYKWDAGRRGLTIAGNFLEFTAEDLSVVLGVPCHGKCVHWDGIKIKSQILKDHFHDNASRFSRDEVKEKLKNLAGKCDKESVEMFVKMFVLLIFATILFPTNNYHPPHSIFVYVDNLNELGHYGWGQAIYQYLLSSIQIAKKAIEQYPEKMHYMDGCVVGLLVRDSCLVILQVFMFILTLLSYIRNINVILDSMFVILIVISVIRKCIFCYTLLVIIFCMILSYVLPYSKSILMYPSHILFTMLCQRFRLGFSSIFQEQYEALTRLHTLACFDGLMHLSPRRVIKCLTFLMGSMNHKLNVNYDSLLMRRSF